MLIMVCAGASEHVVAQWASLFAEKGLGISKTLGDLVGPMSFAIFMGTARAIYGKYGEKIKLETFMILSTLLCAVSYCIISFIPSPIAGVLGCSICGFSVGIMWPGTFSLASAKIRNGVTAMFALMALAGDLGCSVGPTVVGTVSDLFSENLRIGIMTALVFPIMLMLGIFTVKKKNT